MYCVVGKGSAGAATTLLSPIGSGAPAGGKLTACADVLGSRCLRFNARDLVVGVPLDASSCRTSTSPPDLPSSAMTFNHSRSVSSYSSNFLLFCRLRRRLRAAPVVVCRDGVCVSLAFGSWFSITCRAAGGVESKRGLAELLGLMEPRLGERGGGLVFDIIIQWRLSGVGVWGLVGEKRRVTVPSVPFRVEGEVKRVL